MEDKRTGKAVQAAQQHYNTCDQARDRNTQPHGQGDNFGPGKVVGNEELGEAANQVQQRLREPQVEHRQQGQEVLGLTGFSRRVCQSSCGGTGLSESGASIIHGMGFNGAVRVTRASLHFVGIVQDAGMY